jgi:hypothetical protein
MRCDKCCNSGFLYTYHPRPVDFSISMKFNPIASAGFIEKVACDCPFGLLWRRNHHEDESQRSSGQ